MAGDRAPFVKLYNSDSEEISSFERVERFTYRDSVKMDDASTMLLRSKESELVDDPNLMVGRKIQFIFGYIGGITSPKIELYIFDRKPIFDEEGVKLTLELYAKAAYMRLNSEDTVRDKSTAIGLSEELATKWGLGLDSELSTECGVYTNEEDLEKHAQQLSPDQVEELELSAKIEDIQTNKRERTNISAPGGGGVVFKDTTVTEQKITYKVKEFNSKAQSKKSDMAELEEYLGLQEGGPWLASGKDNRLVIARRDFSKAPARALHWLKGKGRLLSFSPQEKNRAKSRGAFNLGYNQWDDEAKQFYKGISDGFDPTMVALSDKIPVDWLSEDEFNEALKGLTLDELEQLEIVATPENDVQAAFTRHKLVGTTGVSRMISEDVPRDVKVKKKYKAIVKDIVDTIENNWTDAGIVADNMRRNNMLGLLTAGCTVIGDPTMLSNNVIEMVGVGNLYSGNWFLDSITHNLSSGGAYKSTLQLVRNATGKTEDITNIKSINAKEVGLDVNKQISSQDDEVEDDSNVIIK